MSSIVFEQDIDTVMDDLFNVYWDEISNNNPSYIQAYNIMRELCEKYAINYNDNVDDAYKNVLSSDKEQKVSENNLFQNRMDIILSVKADLEKCGDIQTIFKFQSKYNNIHNQYRKIIWKYAQIKNELSILLSGGLEKEIQNIYKQESLNKRKEPRMMGEIDENGWPVEDKFGNEITKLETEEQVKKRIAEENSLYQERLDNISGMKISIAKWMEYLVALPKLSSIYKTIINSLKTINELERKMILSDYKKNEQFMNDLNNIMDHDVNKFEYLYHGTACIEDAERILSEGLYMVSRELNSTTYSEFTIEQLLLYKRGFVGEVGSEAIVVIKKPIGKEIVIELTDEEKTVVSVAQSGLGGFNEIEYAIPDKYIIGYINKRDKKVINQKSFSIYGKPSTL